MAEQCSMWCVWWPWEAAGRCRCSEALQHYRQARGQAGTRQSRSLDLSQHLQTEQRGRKLINN